MPKITVNNLTVIYASKNKHDDDVVAIDDLSIEFLPGSFNVVVGCSGCGKTTLLRTIAGLQDYYGEIYIDDIDAARLSPQERNVALVSQQYTLYPKLTVFDNIAMPLLSAKVPYPKIMERVTAVAHDLNLGACLTRKPKQISGGQQQRVALARALVRQPDICLLDEPLSNTDEEARTKQRQYIKRAMLNSKATTIYVTHNIQEAMALADYLIVMDEGKIVISGDPLSVYRSGNPIVNALFLE